MAENKTLEHLPEVRAAVAALSPEDRELLAAVQTSPFKLTAPEQFKEFADNIDYFVFEPNIHDLNDLGWRYLAQHMDMLLPPELLSAIDPAPFGKYAMQEEQGHFTEHGYISLSGDEWNHERPAEPEKKPSIRERLEAWLLLCKKDDANIVKVLEDGLKSGAIRIPGTVQNLNGFDSVHSVTSYLSEFGVTVAERIRNQFQPLFDPAAEQLSPEILRINDYIRAHAGYSLYPAQLAVAESVKRKLSEGKSAFIVAECGSGKTKIGAAALAAYQAQK